MRGRLTALPAARSRNATRIASMQSFIGKSRFTSSSVMMIVTCFPSLACAPQDYSDAASTRQLYSPTALKFELGESAVVAGGLAQPRILRRECSAPDLYRSNDVTWALRWRRTCKRGYRIW